ncbi:hypothetical protein GIB67_010632 [Kingdonia uniflora]|uniref:Uncharacterized protein n=1 Tax=Kingdonia uniflora TaxID=39325 RepID=A0A7J7NQB7_9MAGN|nr:hypothetical protein GIB67_010632 [Kingdonia uniflora]
MIFFTMTEGMKKLILDRTSDLEARHLNDQSRIIYLTTDLRCAEYRLSQLNNYLEGEGVVVDWEDDEGEAGTSQVGPSRGRGSRGRGSRGRKSQVLDVLIEFSSEKEEEEDIDESSIDYSDDDIIDAIKMEILSNQA